MTELLTGYRTSQTVMNLLVLLNNLSVKKADYQRTSLDDWGKVYSFIRRMGELRWHG